MDGEGKVREENRREAETEVMKIRREGKGGDMGEWPRERRDVNPLVTGDIPSQYGK